MQAARTVNRQKVPVYQADLTMIQNTFMAALREVKKEIGNDFTAAQSFDQGHHPADVYRTHQRGGCSYSDHHAGNDFRRRHPERAAGMDGVQRKRWTSLVRR